MRENSFEGDWRDCFFWNVRKREAINVPINTRLPELCMGHQKISSRFLLLFYDISDFFLDLVLKDEYWKEHRPFWNSFISRKDRVFRLAKSDEWRQWKHLYQKMSVDFSGKIRKVSCEVSLLFLEPISLEAIHHWRAVMSVSSKLEAMIKISELPILETIENG